MARWNVEQMAEVWYQTEVEADTLEQAIALTQEPGYNYWKRLDPIKCLDVFWSENLDTGELFRDGSR